MKTKHKIFYAFCAFCIGFGLVHGPLFAAENWCKGRTQSDCTAAVACSWRETVTDGQSKTSCIYNAKAARSLLAKQFSQAASN